MATNHFCGQCGAELPDATESTEAIPASTGRMAPEGGPENLHEGVDSAVSVESVGAPTPGSELNPPVDIPEASRIQRGVYRFDFLYGWFDPVLWLAIVFAVPAVLFQGSGILGALEYLAVSLPLAILIFSGLRYPLAILTRSSRLSRNRPTSSTGEPRWLPDPARLGTWRLWDGTGWTATVSGHRPPPKKGIAVGTVLVGLALTALIVLSLVTGGAVNFGSSTVAASSDPAFKQVQKDISAANEQYAEAQRQAKAFAERPAPNSAEVLQTTLRQVPPKLAAVEEGSRALPASVSASDREKLQQYVDTGQAAITVQLQVLAGIRGCQQRPTKTQMTTCVSLLEMRTGDREKSLTQKWTDAARSLGY